MMRSDHDVKEEVRKRREDDKIPTTVKDLMRQFELASYEEGGILSMRIRGPKTPGDEYLVVVKRYNDEGAPEVAFHTATSLQDLMIGLRNRLSNGTMKWRPDEYAQ